jgi:hypothetical protein
VVHHAFAATPHDGRYTIFARVVRGAEVVGQIVRRPRAEVDLIR